MYRYTNFNWTKKLLCMSKLSVIANFLVSAYIILFYKYNQSLIGNKDIVLISEIIAWIPLISCIFTCVIYSFAMFSEKIKEMHNRLYLSLIFQFTSVVMVMLPIELAEKIDYKINMILLLFFGLQGIFCMTG